MTDELLLPREVANRLRVKISTLGQWRWRQIGPPVLKVGGLVRYPESGLDDWLRSQQKAPGRANGTEA